MTGRAFRFIFCSAKAPQKDAAAIPHAGEVAEREFWGGNKNSRKFIFQKLNLNEILRILFLASILEVR
jgi:hypothetical protein